MFQRALLSDDREDLDEALETLEATGANNLYEQAYLDLARYNFAARFGNADEQLGYLRGALAEAKLRCEQKYAAFAVERDTSYEVPAAWGECSLEIVGDPGTKLLLLQH